MNANHAITCQMFRALASSYFIHIYKCMRICDGKRREREKKEKRKYICKTTIVTMTAATATIKPNERKMKKQKYSSYKYIKKEHVGTDEYKNRQEKNINEPAGVTRNLAPLGVSETQYPRCM